jgi:D-alanine transaminase
VLVHLNGQLVPHERATVSVFDRGFIFGDGLYEGLRAFDGRLVAMDRHVARLRDGLAECRIPWDASRLESMTYELLDANRMTDAFIYWQVTRGAPLPGQPLRARVPGGDITPCVFGFCQPAPALDSYRSPPIKTAIMTRDTRWLRGHVKSISMLGNVIAAIEGAEAGADDAVLIRDGIVAEGTSSNLYAAIPARTGETRIVTPSLESAPMLAGVTRDLINDELTEIEVRSITLAELRRASEIMLAGTLTMVTSIVRLDGATIGDGTSGPVARRLLGSLVHAIRRDAQTPAGSIPRAAP